jgi:hypothetical protein
MSSRKKAQDIWGLQKPEEKAAIVARLRAGLNQITARRAALDQDHALAFPQSDAPQPDVDARQPVKDVFSLPPVNVEDYAEQEDDPAEAFHALFPSREEFERRQKEQEEKEAAAALPEGHPVQTPSGVIFVEHPEEDLERFIQVRTPEVKEMISASTSYQTRTGRTLISWRLRQLPQEAGLEFVVESPKVYHKEPERIRFKDWGGDGIVTWRSGDPDNPKPAPASTRRPYIEEFGRFALGQRNRGVPGN